MKQDSATPHLATELLAVSPLGKTLAMIERNRAILRLVRDCLPDALAEHCRDCAAASDQRLIVFADGPAWAFQLRFYAPVLLEKLATSIEFSIRAIEIRNLPAIEPVKRKSQKPSASPESAQRIRDCAKATSSPELAAALARLAATLESQGRGN